MAFATLLCCIAVLSIFIASSAQGAEEPSATEAAPAPTAAEIAEAEREERERDEWVTSPEALDQREASLTAYAELSPGEAKSLLASVFPEQLQGLNADPARVLSELEIEKVLGTYGARVSVDEEESAIIESSVPVESNLGGEGKEPVDLSLEKSGNDFLPRNPLTEVELPASAGESIELQGGIRVGLPATNEPGAERLGDKNLFYPSTDTATDTLVAPIADGVEVFEQLRSPESPEEFRYTLGLPAGATLRASQGSGAEVISAEGNRLVEVTPPWAVDAQGAEVPVAMTVEGNSVVLEVPHRSQEVAYPLLLDPRFNNGYESPPFLSSDWVPTATANYLLPRSESHLAAISKGSNTFYGANTWGQWEYTAPGSTAYIENATYSNIYFYPNSCQTAQPHGYAGIYNVFSGAYHSPLGVWSTWQSYTSSFSVGGGGVGTRKATVGIGTGASSTSLSCAHELYVGGVTVQENDPENPTISSVSGIPTSGWFDPAKVGSATIVASDPGFGISMISISNQGGVTSNDHVGCTGMSGSRCPSQRSWTINPPYKEGERTLQVTAEDPTGKVGVWPTTTQVDFTKPTIDLQGQLAEVTRQEGEVEKDQELGEDKLRLATYNLKIEATDVGTEGDANARKRSGVKDVAVFLDGEEKPVPWEPNPTPCTSCPLNGTYTLDLSEVEGGGVHKLKVIATDQLGHPREREIEFEYFPATGIDDEYVLHRFPLSSGEGNESNEEHPVRPELAVNVANGNLVYRQQDLEVPGSSVDLEVERFYNSQLPESEDTEWGDGWTLAQTPTLQPEATQGSEPPSEASLVRTSGALESVVDLPTTIGQMKFDKRLQATVEKVPGGYAVTDESGETGETISFDSSGKAEELTNGTAATVAYDYEEGDLAAITVEDPGTADADPETIEEADPGPSLEFLHSADLGSYGSEDGQLKAPGDVATDAQGNLWVLDTNNGRVQKLSPDGEFLSKFGTPGTADGQLNSPSAIAIDAAGNILVADSFRVQKFSPSGQFISKFGSLGTSNGKFLAPTSLAVGSDGSVWVSDSARIYRYSAEGQYLEQIATSGPGAISWSESIAVGPGGEVFIVDPSLDKVKVFDKEGDYLRQFGAGGTAPGLLAKPVEVSVDAEGRVWVADEETDRVQLFSPDGDYIAGFGGSGAGEEQLDLKPKTGIATSLGRVWVADGGNHRISRWAYTRTSDFLHSANLGNYGSENGQLKAPGDVATDEQGNLWVLDTNNGRVQKLGPDGQFISKFGTAGTGDGQLNSPSAIAIDGDGNILVAESHRVQKLSPSGEFLAKFGSIGTGNGQFLIPSGIAVAGDGSIWVTDSSRVQRFTAAGQFIERVGASGAGQITWPEAIAAGPDGEMFVVDPSLDRVKVFDEEGDFVREFGAGGTAPGQLANPAEVSVDSEGQVWIGDSQTDRVQVFTAAGDYLAGFGGSGAGEEQLDLKPKTGIATSLGRVWVADGGNHRLAEWLGGIYEPSGEPVLEEDDPQLEVNVSAGLVDTVEGEESGTVDYQHSGDLLTAVDGARGETSYEYDAEERLAKVELDNGTWGQIIYDSVGRVKSVTVQPAGSAARTTHFSYSLEPARRTVVSPEGEKAVTYDIGEDGSVLKWWNAQVSPEIEPLSGSLYAQRGEIHPDPITIGDQTLLVHAHSEEGIASIEIIANGNQLVAKKTCAQDYTNEVTECVDEAKEWVTSTESWAPGILQLEVLVTDATGQISSERFWVNIPYTPPPGAEAADPPKFADVLRFREEHGLDLDIKDHELEVNERIFDLISAWRNPNTPAGEVARATEERWGVPLRPVDAAELEYRLAYWQQAVSAIPAWSEANTPDSFAGYYLDERAGGLMRVGFTANQSGAINSLKEAVNFPAENRIVAFDSQPSHSLASLRNLAGAVSSIGSSNPTAEIYRVGVASESNEVQVGSSSVAAATALLQSQFGAEAPISVYEAPPMLAASGRERIAGKMLAGERIQVKEPNGEEWDCTTGFGAFEYATKPTDGSSILRLFALTAAHCGALNSAVIRRRVPPPNEKDDRVRAGFMRRHGYDQWQTTIRPLDVAAVNLEGSIEPRRIYISKRSQPLAVREWSTVGPGTRLCHSGATTNEVKCGPITMQEPENYTQCDEVSLSGECEGEATPLRQWCFNAPIEPGDSGGPVWIEGSNIAVGINSSGGRHRTCAAAIAFDERFPDMASVFSDPSMGPLEGLTTSLPAS